MRRIYITTVLVILLVITTACSLNRGTDRAIARSGPGTAAVMTSPTASSTSQNISTPVPTPSPAELIGTANPEPSISPTNLALTQVPDGTATMAPPSPTATEKPPCYQAEFIRDVTYSDGSSVAPGEIFLKIWRFRNGGSCDWNQKFVLDFVGGERFSGPDEVRVKYFQAGAGLELQLGDRDWNDQLVYQVQPDDTVDIALILRAPLKEGRQRGYWRVLTENQVSEVVQFYVDVDVAFSLEEEQELWSGEWEHESQWSGPMSNPLVFHQQARRVVGFSYSSDGEIYVIEASLSADETRMEGSFGQIWQTGWPFVLELYENKNVFNGYYNDSDFTGGAWCGSRVGYAVPFGECLLLK
jgi:hypothetical protein